MKIDILLFGVVKELAGSSQVKLEINQPQISVSDLKTQLYQKWPETQKLKSLLIAINENYAQDSDLIKVGDEIAIIPPVSGG
jgi:molybdopterin synthase sulfur carrier subunit